MALRVAAHTPQEVINAEAASYPYEAIFTFLPGEVPHKEQVDEIRSLAKIYMAGAPVGTFRQYKLLDLRDGLRSVRFGFSSDGARRQFICLNYSRSMETEARFRLWAVDDPNKPKELPSTLWVTTEMPSELWLSTLYNLATLYGPLQSLVFKKNVNKPTSSVSFRWRDVQDTREVLEKKYCITHVKHLLCPSGTWDQKNEKAVKAVRTGLRQLLKSAHISPGEEWVGQRVGFSVPYAHQHLAVGKVVMGSSSENAGVWEVFQLSTVGSGKWLIDGFKEVHNCNADSDLNLMQPHIFNIQYQTAIDAYAVAMATEGPLMIEELPRRARETPARGRRQQEHHHIQPQDPEVVPPDHHWDAQQPMAGQHLQLLENEGGAGRQAEVPMELEAAPAPIVLPVIRWDMGQAHPQAQPQQQQEGPQIGENAVLQQAMAVNPPAAPILLPVIRWQLGQAHPPTQQQQTGIIDINRLADTRVNQPEHGSIRQNVPGFALPMQHPEMVPQQPQQTHVPHTTFGFGQPRPPVQQVQYSKPNDPLRDGPGTAVNNPWQGTALEGMHGVRFARVGDAGRAAPGFPAPPPAQAQGSVLRRAQAPSALPTKPGPARHTGTGKKNSPYARR